MITARFIGGDFCINVFGLVQWDVGQKLKIEGLAFSEGAEVHFSNCKTQTAIRKPILEGGVCEIPDALLEDGLDIIAWVYCDDETIREIILPIEKRKKPDGFVTDKEAKAELKDFRNDLIDTSIKIGGGMTSSVPELNKKIDDVNALGINNLKEKGVGFFTSGDITTHQIMDAIARIPLDAIAEEKYNKGLEEGKTIGVTEGRNAELSDFWDAFQDNGNRTDYKYAFYGQGWNDTTFKPQHNITPVGDAGSIFQYCKITNLKEILEKNNVSLDLSGATVLSYPFQNSTITHLGILDCRNITNMSYILSDARMMESVDKIILKEDGSQTFGTFAFRFDTKLKEIRFEGAIGQSLSFIHCNSLSSDSVQSIIDHLATVETQQNLTLHTSVVANLTDEQVTQISNKNWVVL